MIAYIECSSLPVTGHRKAAPRPDDELARAVAAGAAPGTQAIIRELGIVPGTCPHDLRALAPEEPVPLDPDTKCHSLAAGILTLVRRFGCIIDGGRAAARNFDVAIE